MSVVATGGTPSLTYQWFSNSANQNTGGTSTGATSASYTPPATAAGTTYYYVVVSAAGSGCATVTSNATAATVVADPTIATQPTAISQCVGGTTAFSVTAANGTGAYSYQWSNSSGIIAGATSASYTPPSTVAGTVTYSVAVNAAGNGCSQVTSSTVGATTIANPTITGTLSAVTGFTSQLTGSGTAATSNPWTSSNTAVASVNNTGLVSALGGGTTTITYTANTGCLVTATFTVTNPICGTVHSRNNGNNLGVCAGSGQPYATSVSGTSYQTVPSGSKTGNITFKWATGTQPALEPVITNIWINGISSVCTAGAPTPYSATGGNTMATYCFYNVNLPSTATGTYTLEFTNPQTGLVMMVCTYTGADVSASTPTLTTNTPPTVSTIANQTTTCTGTSQPLAFNIGDAETLVGNLTITATSSNTALIPNNNIVIGAITGSGSSGSSTLTYDPANNQTGTTTITVTVTDEQGLTATTSFTVTVSAYVNMVVGVNNIKRPCVGSLYSGSANVNVSGGQAPYTYTWTTPAGAPAPSPASAPTNLGTGTYSVSVTDICGSTVAMNTSQFVGQGATSATNFTLSNATVLAASAITPTNVTCNGASTGSISTVISGGVPARTITWTLAGSNPVQTYSTSVALTGGTYTVNNLPAGSYTASITDAGSGCSTAITTPVVITQPSPLAASATGTGSLCTGVTTGSVNLTASNGTAPYTYAWTASNGGSVTGQATAEDLANVLPGTYSVVVSDACTATTNQTASASFTILENAVTGGTIAANQTVCTNGNPAAFTEAATATGSGTLTYQWQSSTDNTTFTAISGATSTTYDAPAGLTQTTYYRRVATSTLNGVACSANSNTLTVSVNTITASISGDQTICSGGDPVVFTESTTTPSGSTVTYAWESSTNSGTSWNPVAGETASTYNVPSGLTTTTLYRRITTSVLNGVSCNETSNTVTVTVVADPSISAQPTAITECIGGTSALSITAANGTPSLTYQWYSNTANTTTGATAISGATSASYTPASTTAGTTYYYAIVSAAGNGCTDATSSIVDVNVLADPSITTQASAITECIGGTTALSIVAAGGTPSLAYQWYSNTSNSNVGGTLIAGATNASYTPSSATAGTTYYYAVVSAAGNGCTSVSSAATAVTVVADPSITSQPTNITECIGGTAALSVVASGGTPSLSYQWYDGSGAITGATSASYTPAATAAGSSTYYVIVGAAGAGCTSVQSANAIVTVVADPSISAQPTAITECIGGTSALSITAANGTPSLTYQWYSNTANTTTGATAISGATSASYTPASTTAGTTYYYAIVSAAGNGCTDATSSIVDVNVLADPSITTQASAITECIGGTTALSIVAAGGTPSLAYQWYSNTSNSNVGGTLIAGATNASYTPSSATAGTTYYYAVVSAAGNGCTSVSSAATAVTVVADPSITSQPTNITECIGGTAALSVVASGGTPSLSYQWYDGSGAITGATSASYTPAATAAGSSTYYVIVGAAGAGCTSVQSANATVTVVADPSISSQPTAITECVGGTTALSITAANGTPSLTYQWYSNTANSTTGATAISGATSASYTPASTTAATTYYYAVVSAAGNGCTDATSSIVDVNVIADPSITTQPTAISECIGATNALSVVAAGGTPSLTYQWYSNTSNSTTGGTLIAGATNTSYTPPASAAGTTYYYVVVSASGTACGSVTSAVRAVVVNNLPVVIDLGAIDPSCAGINDGSYNINVASGTAPYTYLWSNNVTTQDLSNVGGGTYSVTVTDANGCTASLGNLLLISPAAIVATTPVVTDVVCFGGNNGSIAVAVSGGLPIGSAPAYNYIWKKLNGATYTTMSPAPAQTFSSNNGAETVTATGLTAGTYQLVIQDGGAPCVETISSIVVNQGPQLSATVAAANATVCAGQTATFTLTGTATEIVTYSLNGAANTTATIGAGGTTNITVANATANQTITLVSVANASCSNVVSGTASITVNQIPDVSSVNSQVICAGSSTTAINFTGTTNISGTTYNWTNNAPSIGLAASGSGNIGAFTATNTTGNQVNAIISVTPTANGCSGTPLDVYISVKPTPTLVQVSNQTFCVGQPMTNGFMSDVYGTTVSWTNSNTAIGLPATGNGDLQNTNLAANSSNAPITGTIVVTPTASGCTGSNMSYTITVNPVPTVDAVTSQTLCAGASTTAVTFASTANVSGTTYAWTNSNTAIGLAASGNTSVPVFTATNTTNAAITATITVTPSANGCSGTPITYTYTVNPIPTVTVSSNQTVTAGSSIAAVNTVGNGVAGATYTWTNTNSSIGLATGGSGNVPSFTATNTSCSAISGTISVSAAANGCTGPSQSYTITVAPVPQVDAITSQTLCTGATASAVTLSGCTPNTTYVWSNNTPAIGLAASGTGNVPTFTATNTTNGTLTATVTVTPQSNVQGFVWGSVLEDGFLTLNVPSSAPAGAVFTTVEFASYGNPSGSNGNYTLGSCHASNSNSIVSAAALGNTSFTIQAHNNVFGDPCSGTAKALAVKLGYGVLVQGTPQTYTYTVNPTPSITNCYSMFRFCLYLDSSKWFG